ncbi:Hsp20/alpha crystallin family protein [Legionella sp. W05-934-2]|uniref:Hsp20/alpha crystallin family protein n=1 Tax=Legionella sp. W05-934-2 TaxID=1198649 RepID=UPI00346264F4
MNKIIAIFLSTLLGVCIVPYTSAATLDTKVPDQANIKQKNKTIIDPFDNDPFFQSHNDIFKEFDKMHQAMQRLMNHQFSKMQHSLATGFPDLNSTNSNNIQIKEGKDELVYKIKLPKESDNKIDVSVKNGQLIISSNVTQKITREEDNSKRVSYSHSSHTQSFQIPNGYDEKSMTTKMKGTNLIITLKKSA